MIITIITNTPKLVPSLVGYPHATCADVSSKWIPSQTWPGRSKTILELVVDAINEWWRNGAIVTPVETG